jgi:hypothetical protein
VIKDRKKIRLLCRKAKKKERFSAAVKSDPALQDTSYLGVQEADTSYLGPPEGLKNKKKK